MQRRDRWERWRWRATALFCICASGRAFAAAAQGAPQHLAYRIAWNGIPAARATIDVTPDAQAGAPAYTISARASTNQFVDLFWQFRGDARTTLLAEPMVPLHFRYERRINSAPTVTWIDFARGAQLLHSGYSDGTKRTEHDIEASDLVDPITAGFDALHADVRVGDTLSYRVFTGEARYRVQFIIRDEDTIEVPAGRFEALRVEPKVIKIKDQERPDKRLHGASIWVTRAPMRMILRIQSEIFVGVVTLDLVALDRAG